MEALLRRTLGEHIEIEIVRSGGLWRTEVDPGQLDAAILNLALNARDAMPAGGRLTIETANARLDSDYAAQHPEIRPGQYVMIAISDTGQGMSGDVVRRAFEPFFTTKEVGKGTGLGLSMLYGFVQQSGGHIKIYSEPGQGTTVRMYFPRAEAPVTPATEPVVEVQPSAGSETILVVEDDALVRAHVAAQLTELGYRVIAAANGVEAMQILERETHVDLLFTDVVMPGGLNGRELASKARALRPGLRILFTSGYAENSVVHGGRLDAGVHLLAKPYRKRDLTQKVREVLDGPDPSRA
jgi:CheY-like chemotaxis protein